MQIQKAEFVVSNSRADQCPQTDKPEYAFIGRSNVGKSSLINMLTGRKALAMTSSTPGKTMLINHFAINDEWFLVDLPGYGYAKRGKREVEALKNSLATMCSTVSNSRVCSYSLIHVLSLKKSTLNLFIS